MNHDQLESILQPPKPLPNGVLPIKYQRGTQLPFTLLRELCYWPEKGNGLSQQACETLFVACGVEGSFGVRYHATKLPDDVHQQIDHAREFAYALRDHILKKAEQHEYGPDPSRPCYLIDEEHADGKPRLRIHEVWKAKPWNEETAVEMFAAYGLDPAQGRRWYAIHNHRNTHPRYHTPFDPASECACYAFRQGQELKKTGKTTYPMEAAASIPAPVEFDWVYDRFRANKLWLASAEAFWGRMDRRNWSHEGKVFTQEELADMIDHESRVEHERRSRL